ncbi:hypothetical protein BDF20DRAFT_871371 [Mycotypha africana]|uniref:uncharacterized protein n=1 Tax=Mycotypha africana TaxID=64632 RepID=UPI002300CF87|nr:uncharacterized protein BDF20DRAFT_871371 [Mycotypha africana]KAI8979740.1 hypothetical protein BDF20DRAFT_871371 [Mycotypha africana]
MLTIFTKGSNPFPPFYSSGEFSFTTPLFLTPTVLLVFILFVGSIRYLYTKHVSWQDISSPFVPRERRLSPLSKLIIGLSCTVTATFLIDAFVLITRVFLEEGLLSIMLLYYIGASWVAWVIALACLMDESHKFSKWYWIQYTFFALATAGDTVVAWLWAVGVCKPRPGSIFTIYDNLLLGIFIVRYVLESSIFILSIVQLMNTKRHIRRSSETSPLLGNASNYGATISNNAADEVITTSKMDENRSGYHDFFNKLRKVMPYIWPHNDHKLQYLVIVCFLLMIFGLSINVFTPLQIGSVVDKFNKEPETFAWAAVLIYVGFKFLQGGSGLIQACQNWLWIPIGQFTTREISIKFFAHLHSLSLHYHINRKTGEVLRVVDRGTNSIVNILSQILFQIVPALANILIAVVVFSVRFSLPFGLIVFITMALYLYVTITMTEWRNAFRRKMIELDHVARGIAVDSLLNFETVKYYNAEGFEVRRYHDAIIESQKADYKNSVSLNVLNLAQNAVITSGLLAGSLLFAYEVSLGKLTAGDFVSFNVYMMQLYTPLHFFGTYYRMLQQNFIDMEKMFDLFEVEETVKDAENAVELYVTEGHVKFDNVSFSYDQRQTALNGISFTIPKGATVALVGPSGGGKSTILRLLFRFYDPQSGHIYIDGQDIASVKQASLRKNIGVVPQDTVLFNDTILYNIRYGDVNASDEDVYRAAKAAQIHDRILSFPDGYNTKVGERGLRLSGGEKQRVAIARTILKNPPIILLDEATSALDTTTERNIQEALADMTKDRTTLVIAHRLSTIINADLILVIKDGKVVESGSHESLLRGAQTGQNDGIYREMWQKQLDDVHDDNQSATVSGASTPKDKSAETSGIAPVIIDQPMKQVVIEKITEPVVTDTPPSKSAIKEGLNEEVTKQSLIDETRNDTQRKSNQDNAVIEETKELDKAQVFCESSPSAQDKEEIDNIDTQNEEVDIEDQNSELTSSQNGFDKEDEQGENEIDDTDKANTDDVNTDDITLKKNESTSTSGGNNKSRRNRRRKNRRGKK